MAVTHIKRKGYTSKENHSDQKEITWRYSLPFSKGATPSRVALFEWDSCTREENSFPLALSFDREIKTSYSLSLFEVCPFAFKQNIFFLLYSYFLFYLLQYNLVICQFQYLLIRFISPKSSRLWSPLLRSFPPILGLFPILPCIFGNILPWFPPAPPIIFPMPAFGKLPPCPRNWLPCASNCPGRCCEEMERQNSAYIYIIDIIIQFLKAHVSSFQSIYCFE